MQTEQTPSQLGSNDTMKYLSLCSGIEAASVAWHHLGWQPFAFSEIEPFPSAVLAHHWPSVPNLGDMTQFQNWSHLEDVDLLVGGTPCQAFSVAGLRKSLDDARGNLTLTYISILNTIDNERSKHNRQPAICVWENVPGVLNTKDNAFGCFLAGLAGENTPLEPPRGKWANAGCVYGPQRAVAWRVLDAQYFGVAQRRRRVFVVASARGGFDPTQILFEFNGLRRDTAPSRETRKGTTTGFETGPSGSDEPVFLDRAMFNQGANAQFNPVVRQDGLSDALVARGPHAVAARMVAFGEYACDETASTMKQRDYKDATDLVVTSQYGEVAGSLTARHDSSPCADRGQNVICAPINTQMALRGASTSNTTREGVGIGNIGDPAFTLQAAHSHAVAFCIAENIIGRQDHNGGNGKGFQEEHAYTLNTVAAPAVAFKFDPLSSNPESGCNAVEVSHCLDTTTPEPSKNQGGIAIVQQYAVRRLTPTECERLQGFPDDHTLITFRGKPATDGPRYKACGNSMAVPVMRWIGERIHQYVNPPSLLAQLKQALIDNLSTRLK
jgi:DNA (cytosine-5)-methyltransferase 1